MNRIDPWKLCSMDDNYTASWFDYNQHQFPQSRRKAGKDVSETATSTMQLSVVFNNLGNFQRTQKITNPSTGKTKTLVMKDKNMLTTFWGQNYGHILLTAEAGTLPMDQEFLLNEFGLTGKHTKEEYLACHAKIGHGGYVRLVWETDVTQPSKVFDPAKELDPKGRNTAAIFEVYFGKEVTDKDVTDSRARGSHGTMDTGARGSNEATCSRARADLRRSGLRKVRCCVLHLHHQEAKRPQKARDWL